MALPKHRILSSSVLVPGLFSDALNATSVSASLQKKRRRRKTIRANSNTQGNDAGLLVPKYDVLRPGRSARRIQLSDLPQLYQPSDVLNITLVVLLLLAAAIDMHHFSWQSIDDPVNHKAIFSAIYDSTDRKPASSLFNSTIPMTSCHLMPVLGHCHAQIRSRCLDHQVLHVDGFEPVLWSLLHNIRRY